MTEYQSETAKYRHLTAPYCVGLGIDIGSQGDPVVPHAWSFDLPPNEFAFYNSNNPPRGPIQLHGHGENLSSLGNKALDFVYSSHLLEDYLDWMPVLREWVRVLKPGGYLVVLIPEKGRWAEALAKGQPPNCSHKHEGQVGELTSYAEHIGVKVVEDRLTDCFPGDYSILFVAQKL